MHTADQMKSRWPPLTKTKGEWLKIVALSQRVGYLGTYQTGGYRGTHRHCLSVLLHVHNPYRRRHPHYEMRWRSEDKDHVTDRDVRKGVLWSKAGQGREAKNCVREEREETNLS